jgi:transposase
MTAEPISPLAAIRVDLGAIFISLELSKSTWLVTSLSPGSEKMSRHSVPGGDLPTLLSSLNLLREKAQAREGRLYPVVVIQEAGLDGFWIHRALEAESWITSHVVDAASIAVSRRHRRAKTDRIDGETLVRTLMAWMRGEPRVCSMVHVPTVDDEDRRRIGRERKALVEERKRHVNRIKGLLLSIGVRDYEPARRDRRVRLEALRTGDGQPLPTHLKGQLCRELDRLELLNGQIKAVEAERDARSADTQSAGKDHPALQTALKAIKGIGAEFANILASEGLFRQFDNRRQVAAYAGLAPSPWRSGVAERFDAGVRLGEIVSQGMIAVRISPEQRMVVVGSLDYLERCPAPIVPQDLTNHNCINLRLPTRGGVYVWELEKDGQELRVRVDGQMTCNGIIQILNRAINGYGLGFVPEGLAKADVDTGRVVEVLADWCPYYPGYHLVYPSRRQAYAALTVVVDALRDRG